MEVKLVVTIADGEEYDIDELRRAVLSVEAVGGKLAKSKEEYELLSYELHTLQSSYEFLEAEHDKLKSALREHKEANWKLKVENERLRIRVDNLAEENTDLLIERGHFRTAIRDLLTCTGGMGGGPCGQCVQIAHELVES